MTKKVIIASSQPWQSSGLTSLIQQQLPEFQITATVDNGNRAVALCRELQPDLLIADIPLYGISGLDAAAQVDCNVLIISERFEARYILAALRSGVKGYINKTNTDIAEIIRSVADGVSVYDKKVLQLMNSGCAQKPLTPNEKQLLRWVVKGYKEDRVTQILGCNLDKVRNLYRCLKVRLKCGTQAQAVFYALKNGYMSFRDFA